jgi:hypothetical protein
MILTGQTAVLGGHPVPLSLLNHKTHIDYIAVSPQTNRFSCGMALLSLPSRVIKPKRLIPT